MYRLIWFAIADSKIVAVWYKNCKQPFRKWKNSVKSLYPKSYITCTDVYIWPKEK